MLPRLSHHGRGARRQIRVAVNLAVRMGQRDADLLTAVLEAEHLFDARCRDQIGRPMPPRVDDQAGLRLFQISERAGVVAGEANHLATAITGYRHEAVRHRCRLSRTGQAREPVFEHDHVVVGCGHLTGQPGRARAQRALVGRRLVGAVLAARRDDHPLPGRPVEPQLRLPGLPLRQRSTVGDRRRGVAGQRKEQQLAAIGQGGSRRRRHAHWVPSWPLCQSQVTTGKHSAEERLVTGVR